MSGQYTIQQTSKLFGVPKSTLRYWQQEGLLPMHKGENGYRQFSMKDMIDLSDIMFYRELQMPVRFLRQLHQMDAQELTKVLGENYDAICSQIEHLKQTSVRIQKRLAAIDKMTRLRNAPYRPATPDCEEIIRFELTHEKALSYYLKDQYLDVQIVLQKGGELLHGLVADGIDDLKGEERLWRAKEHVHYKTCVVQIPTGTGTSGDLPEHLQTLANMGHETGQVLMRYLATVAAPGPTDCYQAWIEVK